MRKNALRHLKAYQCTNCGNCCSKKYSLAQNINNSIYPCRECAFRAVFSELARGLLQDLEGAKKYAEMLAIATRCVTYYSKLTRDLRRLSNCFDVGTTILLCFPCSEAERERQSQQQARRDKRTE